MLEQENKYYTPSIEEFHVGLEVTYVHSNKRINHTIEENDLILGSYDGVTELYEIIKGSPLIKYLDKEDIESLGFKEISKSNGGGGQYICNDTVIYLMIDGDNHYGVRISHLDTKESNLYGVRNKSELRKVLSMLGVKNK